MVEGGLVPSGSGENTDPTRTPLLSSQWWAWGGTPGSPCNLHHQVSVSEARNALPPGGNGSQASDLAFSVPLYVV